MSPTRKNPLRTLIMIKYQQAIKKVDLYDLVQAIKICLVPNIVVPKKFYVLEVIKYTVT
jgi:hypothetical protein